MPITQAGSVNFYVYDKNTNLPIRLSSMDSIDPEAVFLIVESPSYDINSHTFSMYGGYFDLSDQDSNPGQGIIVYSMSYAPLRTELKYRVVYKGKILAYGFRTFALVPTYVSNQEIYFTINIGIELDTAILPPYPDEIGEPLVHLYLQDKERRPLLADSITGIPNPVLSINKYIFDMLAEDPRVNVGEVLSLVVTNRKIPPMPIGLWSYFSEEEFHGPQKPSSMYLVLPTLDDLDEPYLEIDGPKIYALDSTTYSELHNVTYTVRVYYNDTVSLILTNVTAVQYLQLPKLKVPFTTLSYAMTFFISAERGSYSGTAYYEYALSVVPNKLYVLLSVSAIVTADSISGGPGRAELSHVIRPIYALPTDNKKAEITQTGIGTLVSNVLDPEDPPEGWGKNVLFRAGLFRAGTLFNEKETTDQKLTKWVRDIYPIPEWEYLFVTSYWMGVIDPLGNLWVRGRMFERNTNSNEEYIPDEEFSEIASSVRIGKFVKISVNNYNVPTYVVGNLHYICHLVQDEPNKQMHVYSYNLVYDSETNVHSILNENIAVGNDGNVPLNFVAGGPKGSAFFYINQSGHLMGRNKRDEDKYLMGTSGTTSDFVRINSTTVYKRERFSIDATEYTVVALRNDGKIDAIGRVGLNNVSNWTTLNNATNVTFDAVFAGITTSLNNPNNKYGVIVGYDYDTGPYVYNQNVNAMVYTDKFGFGEIALGNGFVLSRNAYNLGYKVIYNPFGNEGIPNYVNVIANTMPDLNYAWGGNSNGMSYIAAVHTDSINSAAYIQVDDVIMS